MLVPSLSLFCFLNTFSNIFASSSRELNRCRSCVQISKEVENRVEKTAKKVGQVAVGKRFGPNGETIHKKLIDYADSENRFLDIFDETLCNENAHKSECYALIDDNEEFFSKWFFQQGRNNFLQQFCFSLVPGCSQDQLDEAERKELEAKEKEKLEAAQKAESESIETAPKMEAAQETKSEGIEIAPKMEAAREIKAENKGNVEETPKVQEANSFEGEAKSGTPFILVEKFRGLPFKTRLLIGGTLLLLFHSLTTYVMVVSKNNRAQRKHQ